MNQSEHAHYLKLMHESSFPMDLRVEYACLASSYEDDIDHQVVAAGIRYMRPAWQELKRLNNVAIAQRARAWLLRDPEQE
jgi:hypothetical protein